MGTKKKITLMLVLILLLQGILPMLSIVFENCFTIISKATTEWDISENGDGTVKAILDEETGTLTIEGTGAMKKWNSSISAPWYSYSMRKTIKKVIIKEGVTSIASFAFYECSSLTSIEIPSTVTSIGSDPFYKCSSLTSINVDINNKKYSSENGILFNKDKTQIIRYPEGKKETIYTIPSNVTSIGSDAFNGCSSLTSIEIPEGVTSIGSDAFNGCSSLTSIDLPEGVTSIEYSAFAYCSSLSRIEIPEGVTSIGNYTFRGCSSLTSIEIPSSVTSIGDYAFSGCSSLTSINIPEGVTNIGSHALRGCSSLTSIEIPEGVTSIGNYTFRGCSSLTSINVDINNKKYTSESGILFNKDKTQIIRYPEGKKETRYTIPSSVTSIGSDAFYKCSSLTSIEILSSVTSIGYSAFSGCSSLTSIEIPSSVTSIGWYAFSGCSSLTSIELPEEVTSIGISVFSGCSSLTSIELPEGVTSIGDRAFYECSSLTSIEIPSSVTSIGDLAFYGCSSLTSIEIPSSVTNIGSGAFYGCKLIISVGNAEEKIQNVELPEIIKRTMNEKDILYTENDFTLTNCSLNEDKTKLIVDLDDVNSKTVRLKVTGGTLDGLTVEVNNITTDGNFTYRITTDGTIEIKEYIGTSTQVIIPSKINEKNVTSIGKYAFYECSSLTSIEIPEGVTSIGSDAFNGCSSLTSIEIPSSVTSIESWAFAYCSSLTNINVDINNKKYSSENGVLFNKDKTELIQYPEGKKETRYTIPRSVTRIGSDAFRGCSSLTSIEILSSVTSIGSYAFYKCSSLTRIEIPISVTSVGSEAFNGCSSLTSINVDINNTKYSSENGVLFNKDKTQIIRYPEGKKETRYIIPSSVTTIGSDAFDGCSSLTSIEIPSSVTSIGDWAFYECNLVIYCRSNSYTKEYAEKNSIKYSEVNPEIISVTGNTENWSKDNVTLIVNAQDDLYGLASEPYSFDGGATWQKENTKVYSQNTNGIIIKVKSKDGAITTYEQTINITKIDKEAPTIEGVEGNPSNWTKEDVTLTIKGAKDTLSGLASEPYSFDGGVTWQKENTKVYSQNTEGIVIKVKDNLGNTYTHETINITKIDKEAPTIEGVEGNPSNWTKEDVTLTIKGAKDTLSGLASEPYSFDGGVTWQKENTKVYSKNTEGIVIKVKDNLGNTYTHETINITKIDKEAPTIEKVEGNPSNWTKEDVTLTIKGAKDTLSGLASKPYSFDGGATWQKENTKVYSKNTEGIVIKVKDNLGNTYTHEIINITKIMKPERIKVTIAPTKTSYKTGENFDKTGMAVSLVYDNKMEEETTNYTVVNGENLTCSQDRVEIQYNENTVIKTEIQISVEHTEVIDKAVAATCTKTGLTEGKHCSVCNEVIKAQEVIPAKGHTWDSGKITKEATCTEDGVKTYTCTVCKTTKTETIEKLGHNYRNGVCTRCGEEEPKVKVTSEKYSISSNKIARSKTKNNNKRF